jgi:DNA-binding PadR family transcriptional regulator
LIYRYYLATHADNASDGRVLVDAESMIPINPRDYMILLALAGEERHGYGIVKEVERVSHGRVRIDPANLYRAIKRMVTTGLVERSDERKARDASHERRRYYRITQLGAEVVRLEAGRLAELTAVAQARNLIPEGDVPA